MSLTNYLFVYGTLKRAFSNDYARFLRSNSSYIGEASVRGKLYLLDWYPGLVLSENGYPVYGEVYQIVHNHQEVYEMLDEYEGISEGLYHQEEVTIEVNGRMLLAKVYETNQTSESEIIGGVFHPT